MPLLSITTNKRLSQTDKGKLVEAASAFTATLLAKPESYVMVILHQDKPMAFAGTGDPCAYVELKSLGLPEDKTADFARELSEFLVDQTGIETSRIYIEFAGPARHMWGWNSGTF